MTFKKSFLICMILLGIFSLGIVCAEDNSTLDDSFIQSTQDDSIEMQDDCGSEKKDLNMWYYDDEAIISTDDQNYARNITNGFEISINPSEDIYP